MAASNHARSIPDIFTDVVNQFTILVRKEAQLARTEMSEKITDLAIGIGLLVGGSVLLIPALVILLQAAVTALVDARVAMIWAALIVGGAALAIGVLLLVVGAVRLRAARPVPSKTIEQLQRDAEVAKSQLRNGYGTTERTARAGSRSDPGAAVVDIGRSARPNDPGPGRRQHPRLRK
jgi:Putative Actinobacterial Holin-X, holin superfamily III